MSGEFLGTFENSVNKQRVIIPAPFKSKFLPSAKQTVIITLGHHDSIAIFPLDSWQQYKEKLKNGTDKQRQLLNNLVEFASSEQTLEGPGRIRISEDLLEMAGIEDSVVIKGEGNFISLWSPKAFKDLRKKRLQSHREEYDSMDYQL